VRHVRLLLREPAGQASLRHQDVALFDTTIVVVMLLATDAV